MAVFFPSAGKPGPNPDALPTRRDPVGPCPWCGRTANFDVEGGRQALTWKNIPSQGNVPDIEAALLRCQGCNRATLCVEDGHGSGIHWYPAPGAGLLDRAVDQSVASAYDEGMRCLGIGANRAAAVMFRSALSLFIKDKGGEEAKKERHLKNALKHMKEDGDLHKSLWNWADHLNQLGNEGAHPEDYDDVTADEATGLSKFVRNLIHLEYEMPARLRRDQGLLEEG